MSLQIHRVQHGVGQGGFHTCSFFLMKDGQPHNLRARFEFVFDCGTVSDGPHGEGRAQFLERRISAYGKDNDVVDAFFISHLDTDHWNGAETLCAVRQVKRIFLPYFQQEELALFIAQQITSVDNVGLGPAALSTAVNALGGPLCSVCR